MDITTDKEEIYISAYGTLREGYGNNRLIPKGSHIGTGHTVERYTLRASGIPFVSKQPLHNVVVDLYKVNKSTLERLDNLEGYDPEDHDGSWYKRELIPVEIQGKKYDAWLYFNESYNHLPIINSGDYANK